jgi:exopolysaccharide production protein ExoZ
VARLTITINFNKYSKNVSSIKNEQILSIQYLRAFAALAIVFHHAREQFPGFQAIFPSDIGSAGVDIFFVISGFIMVFITETGDHSPSKFIWNRIIRIVPLYWFYTAITVLLYAVASGLFRGNGLTLSHVILSLLFIPHQNPGDLSLSPLIKIGWTLNYEMFFYLIFAISMSINYSRRVLITCVFLVLLVMINSSKLISLPPELEFYCRDIVLEFAAGMLLCHAYRAGKIKGKILIGTILLSLGISALIINMSPDLTTFRAIKLGIPAMAIVSGLLAFEHSLPKLRLPLLIANASYSIYLSHIMVIAILRYLYPRFGIPTAGLISTLTFVLISLTMGILCGMVSFFVVEKPLLKLCRQIQKSLLPST